MSITLFSPRKETPEFTEMGEIHELFVLVLSLVWFAGATPKIGRNLRRNIGLGRSAQQMKHESAQKILSKSSPNSSLNSSTRLPPEL